MLSCASVAVAAMPKLAANANATTMCVARIDFLLGCLLPGQHRVLRVHDLTSKGTALLGDFTPPAARAPDGTLQ